MGRPEVVSCIIHFACSFPSHMMIGCLITFLRSRELGDDIFDAIPHGWTFIKGMEMVAYSGTITLGWSIFQFAASAFCRGLILSLVGVVDFALAAVLLTGVVMQRRFLPGTYSGCNGAAEWNNGADGRNFFVVASESESFDDNPNQVCHKMMVNWALAIVIIILYLVSGVVNVIIGGIDAYVHRGENSRRFGVCVPWPLLLALWPVRFVYKYARGTVSFAVRYLSKSSKRWGRHNEAPSFRHSHSQKSAATESEEGARSHPSLHGPPLPMELTMLIAEHLHYADLVNIVQSSKRLRAFFFGNTNHRQVVEELRQFVCKGSSEKRACTLCGIQTCRGGSGCTWSITLPESEGLRHLKDCRPACSACFYKDQCVEEISPDPLYWTANGSRNWWRRRNRWRGSGCGAFGGVEMLGNRPWASPLRDVCQRCAAMPDDEMRRRLDRRYLREALRFGRSALGCSACGKLLPDSGVRWWVDQTTLRECKWHGHPGYM